MNENKGAAAGKVQPAAMGKAEIAAEADSFFEWPEVGAQRDVVTLTSCLLFAEHIAAKALRLRDVEA